MFLQNGEKVELLKPHPKAGKEGTIVYVFPYRPGRRIDENLYSVHLNDNPASVKFLVFESQLLPNLPGLTGIARLYHFRRK